MIPESRSWFAMALIIALFWLIWRLAPVITPFAIAAGLAYLGDPLVDRLERFKLGSWQFGRTLAVVIVFGLMTLLFGLLLVVVIPLLVEQVRHLIDRLPAYYDWVFGIAVPWVSQQLGVDPATLDRAGIGSMLQSYWGELSGAVVGMAETLTRSGQAVVGWVTNLVLIPVVTFYLLRDWDVLISGVRRLLPPHIEPTVSGLAAEIDAVMGAFLRGQVIVMLALGVIYTIGLWLVGIEAAFLIGMGAGLLSIVPYLGSIIGLLAAVIAALFQYHDLLHVALVALVFVVGQSAEGMFLTPKLVGDRVGLHPVAVIFAILAGGQLFGFLGILLALPAASALNVLVRHFHRRLRKAQPGQEADESAVGETPGTETGQKPATETEDGLT
jgi:predicted PurR-regulated permease PerM